MKVVLEGPDNAGKTTLAKYLREQVQDLVYFHPGGRPADIDAELKCLTEQRDMMFDRDHILFDRVTCISQQVYNPGLADDWQRQQFVEAMVGTAGLLVVYCRPPNEVLMDVGNFTWRPEETEEHKQKIISRAHEFVARYDEVMLRVPVVHYDWKDPESADFIKAHLVFGLHGHYEAQDCLRSTMSFGRKW